MEPLQGKNIVSPQVRGPVIITTEEYHTLTQHISRFAKSFIFLLFLLLFFLMVSRLII